VLEGAGLASCAQRGLSAQQLPIGVRLTQEAQRDCPSFGALQGVVGSHGEGPHAEAHRLSRAAVGQVKKTGCSGGGGGEPR
jgi:hypothetical protein